MSKYIDVDKLIAVIKSRIQYMQTCIKNEYRLSGKAEEEIIFEYKHLQNIITSLQQEHPEVQNGKFVFPKYLYARTQDNKTIDMSYAPQDMTAVEYIRNDFVQQEQPEVDLEKEIDEKWDEFVSSEGERDDFTKIARHF